MEKLPNVNFSLMEVRVPFDGDEKEYGGGETPKRIWWTINSEGQKNKIKRWRVDVLGVSPGLDFWQAFSFYAKTKREANGVARHLIDEFRKGL